MNTDNCTLEKGVLSYTNFTTKLLQETLLNTANYSHLTGLAVRYKMNLTARKLVKFKVLSQDIFINQHLKFDSRNRNIEIYQKTKVLRSLYWLSHSVTDFPATDLS